MNTKIRVQLSVMMFLQFFIWGAWYVTAPNYLGTIGFKAGDFGWTYSVGPIAGMISPFFVGMIADRFFRRPTGAGCHAYFRRSAYVWGHCSVKDCDPLP